MPVCQSVCVCARDTTCMEATCAYTPARPRNWGATERRPSLCSAHTPLHDTQNVVLIHTRMHTRTYRCTQNANAAVSIASNVRVPCMRTLRGRIACPQREEHWAHGRTHARNHTHILSPGARACSSVLAILTPVQKGTHAHTHPKAEPRRTGTAEDAQAYARTRTCAHLPRWADDRPTHIKCMEHTHTHKQSDVLDATTM